jgi:hypothetical protein
MVEDYFLAGPLLKQFFLSISLVASIKTWFMYGAYTKKELYSFTKVIDWFCAKPIEKVGGFCSVLCDAHLNLNWLKKEKRMGKKNNEKE